jgi:hypothetical protein
VIALVIGAYLSGIGYNKMMQKVLILVTYNNLCFSQTSQASPLYKALHAPWCQLFLVYDG